jgi:hypothetical protein
MENAGKIIGTEKNGDRSWNVLHCERGQNTFLYPAMPRQR